MPNKGLLPVREALLRLLDSASVLKSETVELGDAAGRVLAREVIAKRTQPPFPASAMDGYALRAIDTRDPEANIRVIGQAPAGHGFAGSVGPGQAVRIFTGAPVPEGADAVLIQENAEITGSDTIRARSPAAPARYIRKAGLDFCKGERLLEAGRELDAAALSLAAAANHVAFDVVKLPKVAILATGDELLPPGSELGPDKIIASNSYGVMALAVRAGAKTIDLGIVPDDRNRISQAIESALNQQADILVTLGGASVGDHDLVREVLEALGMKLSFWKIAMRPGKPLMVGRLGPMQVLGLPGNPVSSLVCSHLFLLPLIARLAGKQHRLDIRTARLAEDMAKNDEREDYVRAVVRFTPQGLSATPFGRQDSSMLKVLAASNGLIIRAPHAAPAAKGEQCEVLMIREVEHDNS